MGTRFRVKINGPRLPLWMYTHCHHCLLVFSPRPLLRAETLWSFHVNQPCFLSFEIISNKYIPVGGKRAPDPLSFLSVSVLVSLCCFVNLRRIFLHPQVK